MNSGLRANLELGVNIVIAIAIVAVAVVVVKRQFFSPPTGRDALQQQAAALKGTRITVSGVDWKQNQKSLILFLKKDCVYCTSSAPFYRQLLIDAKQRNVKSLAVLPDSLEQGLKYVQSLELPIDVRSTSLIDLKITGTPTVVLVDHEGIVRSAWVGAMPGREQEMRAELVKLFEANYHAGAAAK